MATQQRPQRSLGEILFHGDAQDRLALVILVSVIVLLGVFVPGAWFLFR